MAKKQKGIIATIKDIKKKQDKISKSIDKAFGTKPASKAPQKPKTITKKYKLSKFNPDVKDEPFELDCDERYYLITDEEVIIGYFPAAASSILDEYDGQNIDFDISEDGYCTIKYEEII